MPFFAHFSLYLDFSAQEGSKTALLFLPYNKKRGGGVNRGGFTMANYTQHYQLHQWVPEDDFLRTDFNEDFKKIDTAIKTTEEGLRGELNGEASRLDGEVDRLDGAIATAQQAVQKNLNTQVSRLEGLIDSLEASKAEIFTGRYTGTGTFGTDKRNSLSFSKQPTVLLLFCPTVPFNNMAVLPWISGSGTTVYTVGSVYISLSWQGNTVYWWSTKSADEQFNASGTAYYYVAL